VLRACEVVGGNVGSGRGDCELERSLLLSSLLNTRISDAGLNETLLLVDMKEPIDASSCMATKFEPVEPREVLSQSTNQSVFASIID